MAKYALKRLTVSIPTLVLISVAVFVLMRLLPGDLALAMLTGGGTGVASAEQLRAARERLGLDKPLVVQYGDWAIGIVRGDLGRSFITQQPVLDELARRAPRTLELVLLSLVVAVVIAIPAGVLSAIYQDTWFDYFLRVVAILGVAMPTFWTGTLLVIIMVRLFNWIPPLGYADFPRDPVANVQQVLWPALVLGYYLAAVLCRMTRSSMLEVLRQDYVRTAWAKGLNGRVVLGRHAFRNALFPVVTLLGIHFATLMSGSVIVETIFSIPGIGLYIVDSILARDYLVVQTTLVLFVVVVVLSNLAVDILYAWLDPRVEYQ